MAKQLLGKEVTAAMNEKLQQRVAALKEKGVTPKLAIVRCGENPSDLSYEKGATSRAELIGVDVVKFLLPEDVTTVIDRRGDEGGFGVLLSGLSEVIRNFLSD